MKNDLIDNHPACEARVEPAPERRHYDRRQIVRWPAVDMRRARPDRRSGEFDTYTLTTGATDGNEDEDARAAA